MIGYDLDSMLATLLARFRQYDVESQIRMIDHVLALMGKNPNEITEPETTIYQIFAVARADVLTDLYQLAACPCIEEQNVAGIEKTSINLTPSYLSTGDSAG